MGALDSTSVIESEECVLIKEHLLSGSLAFWSGNWRQVLIGPPCVIFVQIQATVLYIYSDTKRSYSLRLAGTCFRLWETVSTKHLHNKETFC